MDKPKMERSLKNFTLSGQLLGRSGHKFRELSIAPISCIRSTHNQQTLGYESNGIVYFPWTLK